MRISKSTPEGTMRYAYDAEDAVLELDGQNHPTRSYTHGPGIDDLLGSMDPRTQEASYFLSDRLGSVTAILDQAGAPKETFTHGPFGEVTSSVIASGKASTQSHAPGSLQPHFTGRQLDPETDLYYYRSRYYAPDSGRFTTPDPFQHSFLLGGRPITPGRRRLAQAVRLFQRYQRFASQQRFAHPEETSQSCLRRSSVAPPLNLLPVSDWVGGNAFTNCRLRRDQFLV